MGFAISTRSQVDPRLSGNSPVDPRDESALSPTTGAADDVRVVTRGRRMATENATYANTQILIPFGGTRSVGAHVVDVANPSRDCLVRSVSGDPALYRVVRLNGSPDEITYGAGVLTAPDIFSFEFWGRVRTPKLAKAANENYIASLGTAADSSNSDWVLEWNSSTGNLQVRFFRYSGGGDTLTGALDIVTGGPLFYAAITATGTTGTLYGMVAGGSLAQLAQNTGIAPAPAPAETAETLYIGSFISASPHTGLDVAGSRFWSGVALSQAQLAAIAGKRCYYGEEMTGNYLEYEILIPATDWESTTVLTDLGPKSSTVTLVSVTTADWATTPNDLVPALDSGWSNIRGPWDDRPVYELDGAASGVSGASLDAFPVVSFGFLFWAGPAMPDDSYLLIFGQAVAGSLTDWQLIRRSDDTLDLVVSRYAGSAETAGNLACGAGPHIIYGEIDPYGDQALLHVDGTEATVSSLNAFTANAASKLWVGRHTTASTEAKPSGSFGPIVVCSSLVGATTMKRWLAEGVPYDREDVRLYYPVDEDTGTTLTNRGALGAGSNITMTGGSWGRRSYPATVLGTATPGGYLSERVARHTSVAAADGDATELWVGVHDPQNADGWVSIGRALALETNRFDVGRATSAENLSLSPWAPTGTPGELSCSVVVSGQELAEVLRLPQRDEPQVVSVRAGNARRNAIETRYGKLSVGASTMNHMKDKYEAADESVGATITLTLREEPV